MSKGASPKSMRIADVQGDMACINSSTTAIITALPIDNTRPIIAMRVLCFIPTMLSTKDTIGMYIKICIYSGARKQVGILNRLITLPNDEIIINNQYAAH